MLGAHVFLGLFALSFTYAVWKGGAPERTAACMLLLALIGSATAGVIQIQGGFSSVPIQLLIVDVTLAFALVTLALVANRFWPIALAACQVVAVLGHVAKLVAPEMMPLGYAFLLSIWGWPMTLLLAFGTWCHHKRMSAGYCDRPWKTSSLLNRSTART